MGIAETPLLRIALGASLLIAACGPAPTAPTAPVSTILAPTPTPVAPMLNVRLSSPFHVATPGEIRYEVTGVSAIVSLSYSSTDGEIESGAVIGPAASSGVVWVTYMRPGAYRATLKATTMLGTTLLASVVVNVVE